MNTKPTVNLGWLGLLRVGTGLVLFTCFVSLWPDYNYLYGPDGLADARLFALHDAPPGLLGAIPPGTWWLLLLYLCLCVALVAGLATRLVAALLLVLHYHLFTGMYALFSYGADYIVGSCLLYCIVFPAHGRGSTFCLRILQLHVCLIYFFAGLGKALGPTWRNGEALWKAATQPGFESMVKPDLLFLGDFPALWLVGGWVVFLLELSYPFFIWFRATRRFSLWAMISLHIGIALFMGLYSFSALMIVLNLSAFYMPYLIAAKHRRPIISPLRHPSSNSETPVEAAVGSDTNHRPLPL